MPFTPTSPPASTAATPTTAAAANGKTPTGPTPTTAAAGTGPAATQASTPSSTPSDPPVQPPPPGTYRYATTGHYTYGGRDHPLPPITTLTIDAAQGTSQHAARNLRDAEGNGPIVETLLRYQPDGLYLDLLSETNRLDGVDDTRQYRPNPPVLIAPKGAGVGYTAHYDAADGGTNVHVDSTIERLDQVVVDGTPVQCYVVHAVTTLHGTIEGSGDGRSCVSVAYRLLLTESVSTQLAAGPSQVSGTYQSVLQHLTPG